MEEEKIDAILQRLDSSDQGTFGHFIAGRLGLFSGELPWRDNVSNISCIPPGIYTCQLTYSPRFGYNLYLVGPVVARLGIRIHPANLMGALDKGYRCQLNGCIALGEKLGWIDGQKAVLVSVSAVRHLMEYFQGRSFTLEIKGVS